MAALRKVVSIAAMNLRRLLQDRTGAFFVVVFPFLITVALGATYGAGVTPTLGISLGRGSLAGDLAARLERLDRLEVQRFEDPERLREAVERGEVAGALLLPPDYDAAVRAGDTVPLTYLSRPTGSGSELRVAVTTAVDEQSVEVIAARFLVEEGLAATLDAALVDARAAASSTVRVDVDARTVGSESFGIDRGASQQLILFMFVTSLSASSMLIESRRLGVSRRMLASPTSIRTVVAGEALGRYAIALVQGILIVFGTVVLFRVDWGNVATTALVVVLFALAGTGAAMLMGSVLRNAAQAGSLGVFLGLVLAALGGCMVPLEIFPPTMVTIAHVTPHAWALDALTESLTGNATPSEVAGPLAVLGIYAAVLFAGAAVLLRRTITGAPG